MFAHLVNPARALCLIGKAEPIETFANGLYAGEAQYAALQSAYAIRAEIPAISQYGHAHDDACRSAGKKPSWEPLRLVFHSEAGTETCSRKPLNNAGIVPCHRGNSRTPPASATAETRASPPRFGEPRGLPRQHPRHMHRLTHATGEAVSHPDGPEGWRSSWAW